MADLKAGTTVGGQLVWTQGNFPLTPAGNTLLHKTFKVYTEGNKPQAVDNDFVSKAQGGEYTGHTVYNRGISIGGSGTTNGVQGVSLYGGTKTGGMPTFGLYVGQTADFGKHGSVVGNWATYFKMASAGGWIFEVSGTAKASINTDGTGTFNAVNVSLPPAVSTHLTNKKYVDDLNKLSNDNADTRVLRAGDTMTGTLTVPNLVTNPATLATHAPQYQQVIKVNTTIDYGSF